MSDSPTRRARRWIDATLIACALLVTLLLIGFEFLHVRVVDELQGDEAGCLNNLRVLSQALEFGRLAPAAAGDANASGLDRAMARVLFKQGNVVEADGLGRGTVTSAGSESNGTLKVRFAKGEQELDPLVVKLRLTCPAGGQYSISGVGREPRCSVANHSLTNAGN